MPWNGLGTYNLPPAFSPESNGAVIDAVRYNGLTTDVAVGITNALNKNGENSPSANINWGGFKLQNLASPTVNGDAVCWGSSPTLGSLTSDLFTLNSTQTVYGSWNAPAAGNAYWIMKAAGSINGYFGTTEGIAGTVGGIGLRSEAYMAFFTNGGNERMRLLGGGAICINATSQSGIGGGADTLSVAGTIGFLSQLNGNFASNLSICNRGIGGISFYTNLAGVLAGQVDGSGKWGFGSGVAPGSGTILVGGAFSQFTDAVYNGYFGKASAIVTGGAVAELGIDSHLGDMLLATNGTERLRLKLATADMYGQGVSITRVKTALTARNSTTTLTDDPHLIAPLTSGVWNIRAWIPVAIAAGGAGNGWKLAFGFTGTKANDIMTVLSPDYSLAAMQSVGMTAGTSIAGAATTSSGWLIVDGTLTVTGAGNISLQWAQNSSGVQNLTFGLGASLICTKIG